MGIIITTLFILASGLLGWCVVSFSLHIAFKYNEAIDNMVEEIISKLSFIKRFIERV